MKDHSNQPRMSRRHLILGAGAGAGALVVGAGIPGTHPALAADQYDAMRAKWRDLHTGGAFDAADPDFAKALQRIDDATKATIGLVDRSADRKGVFTDLQFIVADTYDASNRVQATLLRLEQMATALRTTGSRYHDDPDLIADVVAGLDTTNRKIYHAGRAEFGNWYHWEIGGANALVNACALAFEHIPAEALGRYLKAIDHFIPDPHYQYIDDRRKLSIGSNRLHLCQAVSVRGVLGRSKERLDVSRDGLTSEFKYVDKGDGFYRDGSYLFHAGCAYNGSYGLSFVNQFSKLLVLYAGTPWEVSGAQRTFAFGAIDLAFAPLVYNNLMMDCVRGRAISRVGGDHATGHQTLEIMLRLAKAADADAAARWRGKGKGWLERDTYDDPLADPSIPRLALFKELQNDSSTKPAPEPVGHVLFASMDRAVHRRPGWAYAISMCSGRVNRYEVSSDRENGKGWHTGEGMTYLYGADNGQFTDAFWPTVDSKRLPGITVDGRLLGEEIGNRSRPTTKWAGGAVLNKEFATIGMNLSAIESPLRAKKSWVCLDESVVALGAGITDGGGYFVKATADAYVNSGDSAGKNFGSDTRLLVKNGGTNSTREAYLRFDVSGVEGKVANARVYLSALVQDSGGNNADIQVHPITGSWAENTVTWNNRPSKGSQLGSVGVTGTRKWCSVDVTAHVRQQIAAGKDRIDLAVLQSGAGLSVNIASSEAERYHPHLSLTVAAPAAKASPVETIVENRNLHAGGTNALVVDGKTQPVTQGWSAQFAKAGWAHLEGVGGYLFPGGAKLNALREERTGSWRDINGGGSPDPITRRYLTLWFDHGVDPSNASYVYVSLPGVSAARTAELAADPGLEVIANTQDLQALRMPGAGITAVNFWQPGKAGGITVDKPCSVMISERSDVLSFAVSDPLQYQDVLTVEVALEGYRTWSGDKAITVQRFQPSIRLQADVRGAQGRTRHATFRK